MKKILILFIMAICCDATAQEKSQGSIPRTPVEATISLPELLDSLLMKKDINELKSLKPIYKKLLRKEVAAVYQCLFDIDTTGKVILLKNDESPSLKAIAKYVEEKFVRYRWKPAYRLGCDSCSVKTLGVLNFIFDSADDYIICSMRINNEKSYEVFRQNISMR